MPVSRGLILVCGCDVVSQCPLRAARVPLPGVRVLLVVGTVERARQVWATVVRSRLMPVRTVAASGAWRAR